MIETDRPRFVQLLHRLAEVHQRPVDADLASDYFEAMKQYDIRVVTRTFAEATRSCQWFPKPVELRSFAQERDSEERVDYSKEPTYRCLDCMHRGVQLVEHFDSKNRSLGTFSAPCHCFAGQRTRDAWDKEDSRGHRFSDEAKRNSALLRQRQSS